MRPDSPLPLRTRVVSLGLIQAAEAHVRYRTKARVQHPHGSVVIELKTDSAHLDYFFRNNWLQAAPDSAPDGSIVALRGDAESYGLDQSLDGARHYHRTLRKVLYLAQEAYANLKVTVRGLCSEVCDDPLIWLHGCSLRIDLGSGMLGVVLLGRSGGGKTTITAALRRMLGNKVCVINDDWGAASLKTAATVYTGETRLHMKYISVNAHDPGIRPTPQKFPSEHYSQDPTDPVPRLLIPRSRVFSQAGIADSAPLTAAVLLQRAGHVRPGISELGDSALDQLERGEYSDYYNSVEQFFNGSLFLSGRVRRERHKKLYSALLNQTNLIALGNVEPPDAVATRLLDYINNSNLASASAHHVNNWHTSPNWGPLLRSEPGRTARLDYIQPTGYQLGELS